MYSKAVTHKSKTCRANFRTSQFAQSLRQAQILILEILNVFLWLKFSPSLTLNKLKRFKTGSCLLVVLLALFSYSPSIADSILTIDADQQFDFAEHYFSNKEYLRAIGEYKRFMHFFPRDSRVEMVMYRIAESYFNSSRFKEAIKSFEAILMKYTDTEISLKSYFMVSECYLRQKSFGPAILNLQNLIQMTDHRDTKDEAYYRIGWIYIEMAAWEKARVYFEKVSAQNSDKYRLQRLSAELDQEGTIARKNPKVAGGLAIIPGAGYFYCERYYDGFIAFLLNAALIYAAYESFDNGLNALGGIITFVELGFYAGNIYGSISSAHKYNRRNTQNFIEKLKQNTKINLSAGKKMDRIQLSFRYDF